MNKKLRVLLTVLLCVCVVCILTACQTQRAEAVDNALRSLSKKSVTLKIEADLLEAEDLVSQLSDWEKNSLQYLNKLETIREEYDQLVVDSIADLQAKIDALPPVDQIHLDSEKVINAAKSAYDKANDAVLSQVTGAEKIQACVARLEKIKEDSWVRCETCGGDGKVICSLCGGRGSREVNHTTPNGKTWRVHQECKTTSTCSACKGKGGIYVEQ